jgi:hypothetical protein
MPGIQEELFRIPAEHCHDYKGMLMAMIMTWKLCGLQILDVMWSNVLIE